MGVTRFQVRPPEDRFFFRVLIFDTKAEMHAWFLAHCEQHEKGMGWALADGFEKAGGFDRELNFEAMCLPYERIGFADNPDGERIADIGTLIFHRKRIGAGIVAHEMGHAAIWYDRLINGNSGACYGEEIGEAEERLLYLLFYLVREFTTKSIKKNLYDNAN